MAGEPERLESNKRKPFEKGEGRVCRYCGNYRTEEEMGWWRWVGGGGITRQILLQWTEKLMIYSWRNPVIQSFNYTVIRKEGSLGLLLFYSVDSSINLSMDSLSPEHRAIMLSLMTLSVQNILRISQRLLIKLLKSYYLVWFKMATTAESDLSKHKNDSDSGDFTYFKGNV